MALILSIETSTPVCSVALHSEGKLIALSEIHLQQAHAAKLGLLIDQLKVLSGINLAELKAVAVSAGPGSYTGLRIGVSLAKGLCMALNVPLISVDTLDVLADQISKVNSSEKFYCPMIDARRMEVYCKVLSSEGMEILPVEAKVIDENSFRDLLSNERILFFGNGAEKCKSVIGHPNADFITGITPSAREVGVLAFKKYTLKQIEDLVRFEPFYLKEFMIKTPVLKID